jgi:hypothetical protein
MEIFSLVTSIVAIVLSLINLVYLVITNNKKLDFNIRNYTYIKTFTADKSFFYLFNVEFINKSRQPISITSVKFIDGDKTFDIDLEQQRLADKNKTMGQEVIERKKLDSADFPINLTSLTAIRKILIMHGDDNLQNKKIKVVINTNRGKIYKKISINEKYFLINDFTKNIGY